MKIRTWVNKKIGKERGWNYRVDNKGAALIVVLVIIGLVSVLASMVMYMSYANYVTKINEQGTKDNFYSAESVLDQINSGLQGHVSVAVGAAYDVASVSTTSSDQEKRTKEFQDTFIQNMVGVLKSGNHTDQYEIGTITSMTSATGLYAYLDDTLRSMALNYDAKTDGPVDATKGYLRIYSNGGNAMEKTDTGLVLRKLCVEFMDDEGFYSQIQTDLRFAFPDITMASQNSFPDVDTYNIIADGGIEASNAGSITLVGNVYAGDHTYVGEGSNPKYGLSISGSTTINISGVNNSYTNLITRGGITVDTSTLNVTKGNVWTDEILLNSSDMKVTGNQSVIYNLDDLTLKGKEDDVHLEGTYVGYGDGKYNFTLSPTKTYKVADLSSAIIVNSKNSTLNMADMKSLYLAGIAYLNPYHTDNYSMSYSVGKFNSTEIKQDIVVGNSIAVKVDQLAYLLPRSCIGVLDGESIINQNPMTQSEYDMWRSYNTYKAGFLAVDYSKIKEAYGFEIAAAPDTYGYQVVAKQTSAGAIYYVYLAFQNDADASQYYKSYLTSVSERVKTYATKYNNKIYLPTKNDNIKTSGNLVSCEVTGNGKEMSYAMYEANMSGGLNDNALNKQYAETYETWCSLLSSNRDIKGDRSKSVFENTIDLAQFVNYALPATYVGDNDIKAVVVNGDYNIKAGDDPKIKLVIASGNVTVGASFSGLIISGGHVDIKSGCTISADETSVQKALLAEVDSTNSVASAFFVNGSAYTGANNTASSSISYTNVKDLIVYENWTKE